MATGIRYHANCLDGIVSAALMRLLHPEITHYIPYRHASPGEQPERRANSIGVDIPYIPGMVEWVDHHASGMQFLDPRAINGTDTPYCVMHFNPTAQCCAQLIPHPQHWDEFLVEVARVDSGSYESAAAACDLSNPVILATRTINRLGCDSIDLAVITALVMDWREDPASTLFIAIPPLELRQTYKNTVLQRTAIQVAARDFGAFVAFDLSRIAPDVVTGISPYEPYLRFPHAEAYVMLCPMTGRWFVRLSANPWHPTQSPPIRCDTIMESFGGGGHARIAGVSLPRTEDGLRDAQRIVETLTERFAPP